MRIHSDKLTADDLVRTARAMPGVYIEITEHGSRKRDHAYEVTMYADPGKDRHGITRRYKTGGAYGTTDGRYRALTWVEWGDFICELFRRDPEAIVGPYDGEADFIHQTQDAAPFRSQLYDAVEHADRWSRALYYARRDREAVA